MKSRDALIRHAHMLFCLLAILCLLAFHSRVPLGIGMLLMLALSAVLLFGERARPSRWILTGLGAAAAAGAMLAERFMPRNLAGIAAVIIGALLTAQDVRHERGAGKKVPVVRIGLGAALAGILLAAALAGVFAPDAVSLCMQRIADARAAGAEEQRPQWTGGVRVYADVPYPSDWPNSTYTVYAAPENRGTFFYVHGGGLVSGDKDLPVQNTYLFELVNAGYNVVTVNYVLAPQFRYPAAIRQINEALRFFVGEAEERYGIDPHRIAVGGDSAGAQLSGQLVNLQTSPDYAARMGIRPALDGTGIRLMGYVSVSGLVDMPRYGKTGFFVMDWFFDIWGRSAFGDDDYALSEAAAEASVLRHVTASFPPSYLSDGNTASFYAQGKDLAERLRELGVPVTSNFPGRSEGHLLHDYELKGMTEPHAAENMEKTLAWFDGIFGPPQTGGAAAGNGG